MYVTLYLGLGLNVFESYNNWIVYKNLKSIYKNNANQPIISIAEFNWLNNAGSKFIFAPFNRNLEPSDLMNGLVIYGSTDASKAWPVVTFMEHCSNCDFELIEEVKGSLSPFLSTNLKGLKVYKYKGYNVIDSPFYSE